jgi:hypothetical protein
MDSEEMVERLAGRLLAIDDQLGGVCEEVRALTGAVKELTAEVRSLRLAYVPVFVGRTS